MDRHTNETREALARRLQTFEVNSAEMWSLLNDPLAVAEHLAELLRRQPWGADRPAPEP